VSGGVLGGGGRGFGKRTVEGEEVSVPSRSPVGGIVEGGWTGAVPQME